MRLDAYLMCLVIIFMQNAVSVGAQQVVTIAPRPLSNQDIIRMVKAKFDDPTILKGFPLDARPGSHYFGFDGCV